MTNNPQISVILSVFNDDDFIEECIKSILTQTFSDFELIIIDDDSYDKTSNIIRKFSDNRIKIIKNQQNIGLTCSLNKAIKTAQGKYIARIDADDIALPNRLECQFRFLENNPDYNLCGGQVNFISENGSVKKKSTMTIHFHEIVATIFVQNPIIHSTAFFRKHIFDKLGGYDQNLKRSQDYDLWFRFLDTGKITNLPDLILCYRSHQNNITSQHYHEQENTAIKILQKYYKKISGFIPHQHELKLLRQLIFASQKKISEYEKTQLQQLVLKIADKLTQKYPDFNFINYYQKYVPSIFKIDKKLAQKEKIQLKFNQLKGILKKQYFIRKTGLLAKKIITDLKNPQQKSAIKKEQKKISRQIKKQPTQNFEKIKVLFIINTMSVGGSEKVIWQIAESLSLKNFETYFITTEKSPNEWAANFRKFSIQIVHLPEIITYRENYSFFIRKFIEHNSIQKVILSNCDAAYAALPKIKQTNATAIDILHSTAWFSEAYKQNCHYLDKSITISRFLKKYIITKYHFENNKVSVIHNGINPLWYLKKNDEEHDFLQQYAIPTDKKIIAFIGRLSQEKNPQRFVETANLLINKYKLKNSYFVIAGDGKLKKTLENQIKDLQLSAYFTLTGYINPENLLKHTDLLTLTSNHEGMPVVILEAMSMGVPVLSPQIEGIPDVIEHNTDGFMIKKEFFNSKNIAAFIYSIINDEALLQKIKKNAPIKIQSKFTIEKMIKKYHNELFDKI